MEVEETSVEPRDPRLCTAHNRAGAPCGKFSMKGQADLSVARRRKPASAGQGGTNGRARHPSAAWLGATRGQRA